MKKIYFSPNSVDPIPLCLWDGCASRYRTPLRPPRTAQPHQPRKRSQPLLRRQPLQRQQPSQQPPRLKLEHSRCWACSTATLHKPRRTLPWFSIQPATDNQSGLWAVWAENLSGGTRQIFSSELEGGAFQARGASLNIHVNVVGDFPTITLAGENKSVPWSAWSEASPGFNDVSQIFASRFNAQTGLWQQAGQDRGGGEASLNIQTNRNAAHPFIFSGSGDPTAPPVPWVAWEEPSINSNATQIFVSKGVKDDSGDAAVIGGFRWEPVGILKASEPTLNVDPFRSSFHPTGVFAETANSVPWVTWHETGGDRPSRIFTARGVADANAPGGFKWINVPACDPNDETTCTLNTNPVERCQGCLDGCW